jgi:hypothetical protein
MKPLTSHLTVGEGGCRGGREGGSHLIIIQVSVFKIVTSCLKDIPLYNEYIPTKNILKTSELSCSMNKWS